MEINKNRFSLTKPGGIHNCKGKEQGSGVYQST